MDALAETAIVILLSAALALVSWKKGFLTPGGSILAFVMAAIIGLSSSIWWLLCFAAFPAVAFAATFFQIEEKEKDGLQEGKAGERGCLNIMGVGVIPTTISIAYYFFGSSCPDAFAVAFISGLAVATADSVASEIGVRDKKTWMITTLKRTETGINGGVSRLGLLTSLAGSIIYSFVAWLVIMQDFSIMFLIPAAAGMIGNLLDSVIGGTLENAGHISKYMNNASTGLIGAIIGFAAYTII